MSDIPTEQKPVTPAPRHPSDHEAVRRRQHKAEDAEVAGRHANSGPKDHKGAR
jgi:hypothetical protein